LLTKTDHQGILDRIAVRVELLRRRLHNSSPESRAHYQGLIGKLELAPSLRRILVAHLGTNASVR